MDPLQVQHMKSNHKEALSKVPNALPAREACGLSAPSAPNVVGMRGIPAEAWLETGARQIALPI